MEEDIRRLAGIILRAPLSRRTVREFIYCGFGTVTGFFGFWITVVLLASGMIVSASIVGTVVGLMVIVLALRVTRRLGALHRRLVGWLLRYQVEAPPKFEPGKGILGRLDRRLRDRAGWRAVAYSLVKLLVAAVQGYSVVLAAFGLADVSYPVDWVAFHNGSASPLVAVFPVPFGGILKVYNWPETFFAAILGAACVLAATWLARAINAGDRWLIRSLLGPSSMSERVSQLERTRALAVDDGAQMRLAALAMNLGMAREKLGATDQATVRELLDAAHRNAVDALADLRDLARGIHPPVLDNGLASALTTLATSSAIPASVSADIGTRPAPAIETIAYFCAAELIANATKHSYANEIKIKIYTERSSVLRLEVSDDGVGGADAGRGSGLTGLAQRVSTVDGRIDVTSPPGGPTTVTVMLPLQTSGRQ
jgi:signal transduction histidine kinase